jgi:hypothetical protein
MSIEEVNKFFTENMNWLKRISSSNIYLNGSINKSHTELISLLYLHIVKNIDSIKNEDELLDWCGKYIIQNSYWTNSEFNKICGINNKVNLYDNLNGFDKASEEDNVPLLEIELENKWKIIDKFIMSLSEKWERRYAQVYFNYIKDGKRPTVRALKEHFKIGHAPSHNIKKEFESKLREFLKTNVVK